MENRKLTLGDLRFMFNAQTRIFLSHGISDESESYYIRTVKFEITNNFRLWGADGFAEIPVLTNDIYAIGENKIEIHLSLPDAVFLAWAEYAKEYD